MTFALDKNHPRIEASGKLLGLGTGIFIFASLLYFIVDRTGYLLLGLHYSWYALVIISGYLAYLVVAKLVRKVRPS